MLFVGLLMCTYEIFPWDPSTQIYFHVSFLFIFGVYIWIRKKRAFFNHFWPFIFSVGYASIWMFLVIHPIWVNFPGASLSIILFIWMLRVVMDDLGGLIAIWLLTNAGGTLISYLIFTLYQKEGLIDTQVTNSFVMKGLIILLLFHGVDQLKRSIRKKKTRPKGAALV